MRTVRIVGACLVVAAGVIGVGYLVISVQLLGGIFNFIEGIKANPTDAGQIINGVVRVITIPVVLAVSPFVIGVLAGFVAPSGSSVKSTSKKFLPWKRKRS